MHFAEEVLEALLAQWLCERLLESRVEQALPLFAGQHVEEHGEFGHVSELAERLLQASKQLGALLHVGLEVHKHDAVACSPVSLLLQGERCFLEALFVRHEFNSVLEPELLLESVADGHLVQDAARCDEDATEIQLADGKGGLDLDLRLRSRLL